ncbi:hypothetical protein L9F63_010251, partial [Diploptera punctata]
SCASISCLIYHLVTNIQGNYSTDKRTEIAKIIVLFLSQSLCLLICPDLSLYYKPNYVFITLSLQETLDFDAMMKRGMEDGQWEDRNLWKAGIKGKLLYTDQDKGVTV